MSNTKKMTAKEFKKTLPKDLGTIAKIIKMHTRHYAPKEIIEAGFNKNTVYRQTREYDLRKEERKMAKA